MTIGAPLNPRLVAAAEPRISDTETIIVRLYPSRWKPGGILVLRMVDNDQDEERWFTSSDLLQNSASQVWRRGQRRAMTEVGAAVVLSSVHCDVRCCACESSCTLLHYPGM